MAESEEEKAARQLREESELLHDMSTGKRRATLADLGSQCGRVLRQMARVMRRPWRED
jgi:hypothetical protein